MLSTRDVADVAKALGAVVREHVAKAFDSLRGRVEAVEQALESLPAPAKGDPGAQGPQGERGADGTAGERGPAGEVGATGPAGPSGPPGEKGEAGERGAMGEPGPEGPQGAIGPQGERGMQGERGEPGPMGPAGPAGAPGEPGPAGERGADGTSVTAEEVAARMEHRFAEWALGFERRAQEVLERAAARIPVPKDGRDGRDALDLEDFDAEARDGGRIIVLRLRRGETVIERELRTAVVVERGVYRVGQTYEAGDAVTWAGSLWIAQRTTSVKPETDDSWRLAVKRGRDGKDGAPGKPWTPPAPVRAEVTQ